eukprot:CAMPEP_0184680386 /NCGR_PEP_ID=MMETSP0312-20130426/3259_1 /TAXON_ID=31354 /ORGANISM="Compsopogon coeruleus, Strain SAG 36.94" /LENGTH=206 /DNA_ID=CAMNT_0027130449 /DNA_START=60 /DNA_END=680 /DNA_ORIENTATION=+
MSSGLGSDVGKLFVARCLDNPVGFVAVRRNNRESHLGWLMSTDRVLLAGPLIREKTTVGSLVLLKGESLEEVQTLLLEDPYRQAGLFESVKVTGWRQVYTTSFYSEDLYVVYNLDNEGMSEVRAANRAAHLAWWNASGREGIVGPLLDEDGNSIGSLLVFEREGVGMEEVKSWSLTDPYNQAELFQESEVYLSHKVIVDGARVRAS